MAVKTQTAAAQTQQAVKIAPYKDISPTDLSVYTSAHIGELVKIRGKITLFNSTSQVRIVYGHYIVSVVMTSSFSDLYEDDWITVYGRVQGTYCYPNILGIKDCEPVIENAFYEKK